MRWGECMPQGGLCSHGRGRHVLVCSTEAIWPECRETHSRDGPRHKLTVDPWVNQLQTGWCLIVLSIWHLLKFKDCRIAKKRLSQHNAIQFFFLKDCNTLVLESLQTAVMLPILERCLSAWVRCLQWNWQMFNLDWSEICLCVSGAVRWSRCTAILSFKNDLPSFLKPTWFRDGFPQPRLLPSPPPPPPP